MRRKLWLACCLAALALALALALPAAAQTYPARAVRFIVPFGAGSGTDVLARIVGEHMSRSLGQAVVVENQPGASGVLAAQNVARAAPDGHTVLIATNTTHAANQSLLKSIPYDPVADFEPVSKLGTITLALIAHPSVPARTVQELVAYAKANPGKLTFGAGSSSSRLAGEMLKAQAGIDLVHVSYRSNPQAITDILGGQISLVFADLATTLPQVRGGHVTGLGVSTAERSPLAPDLPTMIEAGIPGYDLSAWFAAFLPARTPRPIIDKLHAAFAAALGDPATRDKLLAAGIEPHGSTPEALGAFVVSETRKWADIVKAVGLRPE